MRAGHFMGLAILFCLIVISAWTCGCVTGPETRLSSREQVNLFLNHSDRITDYHAKYHSKTDGNVLFDWKSPGLYRMEYTAQSRDPGSVIVRNRTTASWYDASQKTYRVEPEIRYLREHDYQAMVRQIVRDGRFTVTGREVRDGRTLLQIEVLTEPWSTKYTTYASSKVEAWIDPGSGLAWEITTFYPADTVNDVIHYDSIVANTGLPDDHFTFTPQKETPVTCGAYSPASRSDFDPDTLPAALQPGCTTCTKTLLARPVGGFSGDDLIISLVTWNGSALAADPHPGGSIRYLFYSRDMPTGDVRLNFSRVDALFATRAMPVPDGVAITSAPVEFKTGPGQVQTTNVSVSLDPAKFPRDLRQFWLYVHADSKDAEPVIADDWVRVSVSDSGFVMGAGHFYRSGGGYCQKLLVVPRGGTGHLPFAISTGERDTGNITLNLLTSPCSVDHGPLRPDERPAWPSGIRATIDPDRFIGRSFASYLPDMAFAVDPEVPAGDYCFSAVVRTPTGGSEYAPFTLRVVTG